MKTSSFLRIKGFSSECKHTTMIHAINYKHVMFDILVEIGMFTSQVGSRCTNNCCRICSYLCFLLCQKILAIAHLEVTVVGGVYKDSFVFVTNIACNLTGKLWEKDAFCV